MTPTPAPQEARTQTSPKIFLFVRARRMLATVSLVMLALAGSVAALPGLPAVPGAPALPDLPATPDLPPVDQRVDTPAGYASVYADQHGIDACTDMAASTDMLPAAPALPALPVPVAVPAVPVDTSAGAAANACAHADLDNLSASVDGGANAYAAGQTANMKTSLTADQSGASGEVAAETGFFQGIISWFAGLF